MTEYEYEYYSAFQKWPNTNIIRLSKIRIQIQILFGFPRMFIIWSLKATVWVCSLAHSIQMIWWVCRFDINQGQTPHSRHQCTLLAEALVIIPLVTAMVLHAYHSRVHLNTHSREHFHKCEQCDFAFLIQEIWGGIWKCTVGKRQTNATIVSIHSIKHTVGKSKTNATNAIMSPLIQVHWGHI